MGNKNTREGLITEEIDIKSNDYSQSLKSKSTSAQLYPSQEQQKGVDFKIFVGIDFGTDGCGLAYAFKDNIINIHHHEENKYNGNSDSDDDQEQHTENRLNVDNDNKNEYVEIHKGFKDAYGPYDKSRTSVLIDGENQVQNVGGEAANLFVQAQNKDGWKLFERFKMNLYSDPNWERSEIIPKSKQLNKVDLEEMLIPTNGGDPYPSKHVFIAELQKLRKNAMDYLKMNFKQKKKLKFAYTDDDIQWILTVPAIWSDRAKEKMKLWAIEAQLININIKDQLKIVYEPDCASLSVQYACNKWGKSSSILPIDDKPIINGNNIENKGGTGGGGGGTEGDDGGGLITFDDSEDEDRDYGLIDMNKKHQEKRYNEELKDDQDEDDNNFMNDDEEEMKYTSKCYTSRLESQVIKLKDDEDPKIRLNNGDIYILVDAGGGTVDIACHRIIDSYAVEEILHPTGGKWGSMNIDQQFIQLLYKVFGKELIKDFENKNGGMWLQLLDNFCNASKASFYDSPNHDKKYHHITLPMNFAQFIVDYHDDDIDKVVQLLKEKSLKLFDENDLIKWKIGKWNDTTLQLHNKIFINQLFEEKTVAPIIKHLSSILEDEQLKQCKYLILVGGLSNSRYYQQRIYNEFGKRGGGIRKKLKIIIPDKPQLCVVEGAARYGIKPNYIQIRVLSQTYGIRIDYAKESLPNINKYGVGWLENNTYECNETHREYVKNIFSPFVKKNDAIKFNDKPFIQTYFRRHAKQKTIDIKIFASTLKVPLHVLQDECKELGEIQLLFNTNKHNQTNELEIKVEFWFNDTTLKCMAYPKGNRNMIREYQVNYL